MALALYRKYRPKTLDALLGQDAVVNILRNAAKENKIAHAYLFYGPRGTGKTTTARLIAKLANCETRALDKKFHAKGEPCNACRACNEIDANISLAVVEIDAASNRGIDEIRNLKEDMRTAPAGSPHKVFIIDEVHMLTTPAFNALLKTLEEPPAHAIFILATTEYEKLPATVSSRTQRFLFKKLPKAVILEKLRGIAKTEKIAINEAALELVAAAADGSVRDAESLLDQMSSYGKAVDLKAAEELTGRVGAKTVHQLAEFAIDGDLKGALAHLAKASEEGVNIVQLTKDLIHYLRKIVTLKLNPGLEGSFHADLTAEEVAALKLLSARCDPDRHIKLLKGIIRAYTEIRYSPFASVPLEVALIEHVQS